MNRRIYHSFLVTLLVITLTGCWSRRELNEIAIVVALGVDKSGDQYKISAQIVNPGEVASQKGGGGNTPITTYTATGKTVFEGVRRMSTKLPRRLYSSHLRLFVIGEELAAEEGIGKTLDILSRSPEFRTDYFFIVTKNTTAEQVLSILSVPLEEIPANKLFSSLEASEQEWAAISTITLHELLSNLIYKGNNPVLSGIEIVGDVNAGETMKKLQKSVADPALNFAGLAVFKKDKLVGWMDESESKGTILLKNKVKNTIESVECPTDDGLVAIELIKPKTKVTGSVKNNDIKMNISVQGEANVADVECPDLDLTKESTFYQLESRLEENIKNNIQAAIRTAQEDYKTDTFGFGEVIHRTDTQFWQKNAKNWDKYFADLVTDVHVSFKIRRTGTKRNSFLKRMEE